MTTPPDLTTDIDRFIRARLAEVEHRATMARADAGAHWPDGTISVELDDDADLDGTFATRAVADHVTRHDPGRELHGIDIKRQILNEHAPTPTGSGIDGEFHCSTCVSPGDIANEYPDDWHAQQYPCRTLRLLASEWSGHRGHQKLWTP